MKTVKVADMALNHVSKYLNPTNDLNCAIHDLMHLSLLDWRQTTYLSTVLSMEMNPLLRTIHWGMFKIDMDQISAKKETVDYSFFQAFSLEEPVQLTTVVWVLLSKLPLSLFLSFPTKCWSLPSVIFKWKSWTESSLLNYPVSWTNTLSAKVGSMVVNRTAWLSLLHPLRYG